MTTAPTTRQAELVSERERLLGEQDVARQRVKEIEYELARLQWGDLPQEDGWYLNNGGEICRRLDGVWDDGWGNSGPDYDNPELDLPLTRLVVQA